MLRLSFSQDNCVKKIAGTLDTHHPAAGLVEIVQFAPDFQCFGFQLDG